MGFVRVRWGRVVGSWSKRGCHEGKRYEGEEKCGLDACIVCINRFLATIETTF